MKNLAIAFLAPVLLVPPVAAHPPTVEECAVLMKETLLPPDAMRITLEGMAHYQSCDAFREYLSEITDKTVPEDACQSRKDIDAWIDIQMLLYKNNYSDEYTIQIQSCMEQSGYEDQLYQGVFPRTRDCLMVLWAKEQLRQ